MRTYFIYDGHEIVVERTFSKMRFLVDGKEVDLVDGVFQKDHDKTFYATVNDSDGGNHAVTVKYISGGVRHFFGTLVFLYDGKKIDVRSTT